VFEDLVVDVVEVKKVCSNLCNPIRLYHYDSADVDHGHLAAQERFVLHPRDDIV
jgi:hypothetical protein